MLRRLFVSALASGALLGAAGCKHRCCRTDGAAPQPFLPAGPGTTIPPAGVPTIPPGAVVAPNAGRLPPPDFTPPSATPSPAPSPSPAPTPGGGPARDILLPDPLPGGSSSRSGYPAPVPDPILGGPITPAGGQTLEPPLANTGAAGAMAGVPGFAKVKEGVASGRKPTLDGFDALKRAGYRTAVYLHPAGADTSAARSVAEKRGLAFVAVETTPEKLADAADTFNRTVADRTAGPVYVYDDDGLRAGSLWYLHFRTVELQSGEVAKIRARSLGLTDGPEANDFWLAINQYLATR